MQRDLQHFVRGLLGQKPVRANTHSSHPHRRRGRGRRDAHDHRGQRGVGDQHAQRVPDRGQPVLKGAARRRITRDLEQEFDVFFANGQRVTPEMV